MSAPRSGGAGRDRRAERVSSDVAQQLQQRLDDARQPRTPTPIATRLLDHYAGRYAEQIVAAMQRHGIPVTYVYYPDERHGLGRPENRQSFAAVTEAFHARHLGGRRQPIGDEFDGSTITFRAGRDLIPPDD